MANALPMPDLATLTDADREILREAPLNVFRMSAHVEGVLKPFYEMTVAMLRRGKLDPRSREILILRTAGINGAEYEWRHHSMIAGKLGMSDAEVERLRVPGDVPGLDEDDALLVRAAQEIARDVGLSGETLAQLQGRYPIATVIEIIFCCSYYNMVSRFLVSTGTPFEEGGATMQGGARRPGVAPWRPSSAPTQRSGLRRRSTGCRDDRDGPKRRGAKTLRPRPGRPVKRFATRGSTPARPAPIPPSPRDAGGADPARRRLRVR